MIREHTEHMLSNLENITFALQVGGAIPPTSDEHLTKFGFPGETGSANILSQPLQSSLGQSSTFWSGSSIRLEGEPIEEVDVIDIIKIQTQNSNLLYCAVS